MVRVYTYCGPISESQYIASCVIADSKNSPRILVKSLKNQENLNYATKSAVRWSVKKAAREYNGRVKIFCPYLDRPQLEIGRLPPDIREEMQWRDISVQCHIGPKEEQKSWTVIKNLATFFGEVDVRPDINDLSTEKELEAPFEVYTDGALKPTEGMGCGCIIIGNNGGVKLQAENLKTTVNTSKVAEAFGVELALSTIKEQTTNCHIDIYFDWNKLRFIFDKGVQDCDLPKYMKRARQMTRQMKSVSAECIYRENNKAADALAKMGRYMSYESRNGIKARKEIDKSGNKGHKYASLV